MGIDFGNDIRIISPYPENVFWTVFIQDQHKTQQLRVLNDEVATSGVYERFIEIKGKCHSHLLNPKIGSPIEEYIVSLLVLANQCIITDSIST